MKKILFVTGSRGEWGYIRPILNIIRQRDDLEYVLVVTNMHLLAAHGSTYKEIEKDGYEIKYKVHMCLEGYNHYTMSKSLGIFMTSFPDILENEKPDWILLAGDRGEQLIAAIVGAHSYYPVAHIQAGELSGNIDGMTRHAIGKFAHIHFAANQDAAERLLKLGEEEFRIHNVGAPQLDEIVAAKYATREELNSALGIELEKDFILVVLHPVTEEAQKAKEQAKMLIRILNDFDIPKVVIMPNNDAGAQGIQYAIEHYRKGVYYTYANLKREYYLSMLKHCRFMIGNSSSGLLEAPTFRKPAVNIGRRQNMRFRGNNVIDCAWDEEAVREAAAKAMSPEFTAYLRENCNNPYGDGHSSKRIIDILINTQKNEALLIKNLTY